MNKHDALSIFPKAKASVPSGNDGQIAVATDQRSKLLARVNGELTPVVSLENTESISMVVDPVGGTSPAAGTVVTNQDDYDALGDDLLYMQDVIDILPDKVGYPIFVTVKAGTLALKPGNIGVTGLNGVLAGSWGFAATSHGPPFSGLTNNGGASIMFTGESNTTLEAAQAGTSTATTITRSAGTWTVDEHRGKWALIATGPAAGEKWLIESNTTTALTLRNELSSTGSVTFEIVEPAAVCADSSFPFLLNVGEGLVVELTNIKIGTAADPNGSVYLNGIIRLLDCWINVSNINGGIAYRTAIPDLLIYNSYISGNVIARGKGDFDLGGCLMDCVAGGSLEITEQARCFLFDTTITAPAGSGYTFPLVQLYAGKLFLAGGIRLDGDGTADGILLKDDGDTDDFYGSGPSLQIDNCDVALRVERARVSVVAPSGTGNTTGIQISERGDLLLDGDPSSLSATTEISLDGTSHDYTDLPSGSFINGSGGSRIVRT